MAMRTSRRFLLGASAAAASTTIMPAANATPAHPDAELISCCAELTAIEAESWRLYELTMDLIGTKTAEHKAAEAYTTANRERVKDLERFAPSTTATTVEGIRAKAAYAATFVYLNIDGTPDNDERFVHAVLRDLAAWRAGV